MRLVFFGASAFGLKCLQTAISLPEVEVLGILTAPAEFSISYRPQGVRNVLHADFHRTAKKHNIPIHLMQGKMTDRDLVSRIRSWRPDVILAVGWYHMVPKAIRDIAPTVGLHASLLPDYSGGAPLVWAIINGEKKTGITFFVFGEGVDNGPIIDQKAEPIFFEDTIATLLERIQQVGIDLLREHLPQIQQKILKATPQVESKRRTCPQRGPEDGEINWTWRARRIYDFIRAQTKPYPGAFTLVQDAKLTLWAARPVLAKSGLPFGTAFCEKVTDDRFYVVCGDSKLLEVLDVELNGKRVWKSRYWGLFQSPGGVLLGGSRKTGS